MPRFNVRTVYETIEPNEEGIYERIIGEYFRIDASDERQAIKRVEPHIKNVISGGKLLIVSATATLYEDWLEKQAKEIRCRSA